MDRFTDPRTYECALKQSMQTAGYVLDPTKFSHCKPPSDVLKPETEEMQTQTCVERSSKIVSHTCQCSPACKCGANCRC